MVVLTARSPQCRSPVAGSRTVQAGNAANVTRSGDARHPMGVVALSMTRDAILARWPRLAEVGIEPEPIVELSERDSATAKALNAYLMATTEVPTRGELRL